jgi:BMFP domain-containing protein YqiC
MHPQLVKSANSNFDIKTDIEFIPTNTNTKHLEEKLSKLETQLKSDRPHYETKSTWERK